MTKQCSIRIRKWSVGALERGAHCWSTIVGKRIGSRWEADRRS